MQYLNNIFPVTGNNIKEFCGNLSSFYPDKKAQEPKKTAEFMLCCGICNNKIGIHNLSKNSIFTRLLSRSKGFTGIKKLPGRIKMGLVNGPAAGWNRLLISREEVEIATVLACGQSFRWKANNNAVSSEDADGTLDAKPNAVQEQQEWIGVFGHHLWVLKQNDAHIDFKAVGRNHVIIKDPLDSESLEKLLRVYFQLDISLPSLYKEWAAKDEKFAKLTVKDFQGIRMLAQDPIENLFSFICSSNNNIQRISQMVEKLCLNYGDKIVDYEGKAYFDFPRVERLVGDDVEKKLREESFGYRAGFIAKTAEKIVLNGGVKWVESLKKLEYDEARIQLQTLPGIGRKVADCICLMSLGFPQAIPVDTHIHQVAKVYLPHLEKVKTLTDKVYSEIVDYFRSIYGDYAGWAHSVLFASTLRHLKVPEKKAASRKKTAVTDKLLNESTNGLKSLNKKLKVEISGSESSKKVRTVKRKPIAVNTTFESDPSLRRSKRLAK